MGRSRQARRALSRLSRGTNSCGHNDVIILHDESCCGVRRGTVHEDWLRVTWLAGTVGRLRGEASCYVTLRKSFFNDVSHIYMRSL
jgi:hypothetical protein